MKLGQRRTIATREKASTIQNGYWKCGTHAHRSRKNEIELEMNKVRNEEVCMRAGIERELASRADQRVLRWFGHVEKMDEYRTARRVLMTEVSEGRVRGSQRLCWMDGVKVALDNRGMAVEVARQCAKDRKVWRALVHM